MFILCLYDPCFFDGLLMICFDDLIVQRMIRFMMSIPHSGRTPLMNTVSALYKIDERNDFGTRVHSPLLRAVIDRIAGILNIASKKTRIHGMMSALLGGKRLAAFSGLITTMTRSTRSAKMIMLPLWEDVNVR